MLYYVCLIMYQFRNLSCIIAATFLITSCEEEPPPPPPAPVEKKVEKVKPSFSSSNALSKKDKKTKFGSKKEGLGGSTLRTDEGKGKVMLQGSK